jgi:uncharacterized protein YkwD
MKIKLTILILLASLIFTLAFEWDTPEFIELYNAINDTRSMYGLTQLRPDTYLTEVAQGRAEDMAVNGYFKHLSYGLVRQIKQDTREQNGLDSKVYIGEILARGKVCNKPDQFVGAWLGSYSHRNCMLDSKFGFVKIGIGIAEKDGKKIIVVLFANQ